MTLYKNENDTILSMKLECTFEVLDWKGKIVNRKKTYSYPFSVNADMLLKASIEGNFDSLPIPNESLSDFINKLGMSFHLQKCWKKGIAKFNRWNLIAINNNGNLDFAWKMTQ